MQIRYVTLLLLLTSCFHGRAQQIRTSFLVCGDHQVLLVDYNQSRDSIPKVVWTWDAHHANDLPEEYRLKKFNTVDDCKPVKNGDDILVSSSSGAVAIVERKNGKVKFYAPVPNAHSIELLPGNFLAAAASTADKGNSITKVPGNSISILSGLAKLRAFPMPRTLKAWFKTRTDNTSLPYPKSGGGLFMWIFSILHGGSHSPR